MKTHHPSLPAGLRLYAIGDIHGRVDLVTQLIRKIEEDDKARSGKSRLLFLGDYIDRGLFSRQVIELLMQLEKKMKPAPLFLLGNHEQVMREVLQGDDMLLLNWMHWGGRETLLSYGVTPPAGENDTKAVQAQLATQTPPEHQQFFSGLQSHVAFGDYFFCHAGVRPGVELKDQSEQDLIWIRHDFLKHQGDFGKVIVHGHSISMQPEILENRINIDTGAYATGTLTALGLEGTDRWLIQTG
jgi:serine/threonine protein phosphatase 1